MRSSISLPVIERLVVRNFSLYPGVHGNGLDITFENGISVIAGINGIGKTTLLTLLLRLLLGPSNPEKATKNVGRVSQRRLVEPKKFDFFSSRVPEKLGDDAYATLYFSVGQRKVEVSRYMRDMCLKGVKVSGRKHTPAGETEFIEELASMSGLLSAYDFHMVVRYLQFFGEDRLPLLWEPSAQFEFFKILFFDESVAETLNKLFALIQKIDSEYRNRTNILNRRKNTLPTLERPALSIEVQTSQGQLKEAKAAAAEAEAEYINLKQEFDMLQREENQLLLQTDDGQIKLAELEAQFLRADSKFILQALPSLGDKERFLMQGYATGCGCFICGAKSKKQLSGISKKIRKGHCFVCDSQTSAPNPPNVTPINVNDIHRIEADLDSIRYHLAANDAKLAEIEERKARIAPLLRSAATKRALTLQAVETLDMLRPVDEGQETNDVYSEIDREQAELDVLAENRKRYTSEYRAAVDNAQEEMSTLKADLETRLTNYAMEFLQERVSVAFNRQTPFKIATGADRVNIPAFTVKMTSGTHKLPSERSNSSSVSESQKEFLDLAFRMTLLDMINTNGQKMLVIETPEASLDSWFMRRAADLMRSFAPEDSTAPRKVIATSNLNGTEMIPALLGLVDEKGKISKLQSHRSNHFVNLLELTPPPAALAEGRAVQLLHEELGRFLNAK
ncbi:TPA: AAA family ATPase [Pseudomonas aeruginosa]|nr:AAA family ATPase [Pseudomonas aeruginosa]HCJ0900962.1 AAA family ATPase [Pseudomonas aeruginosa]HCJ1437277.1 AAA family ATPase [Pseudomonas aeruginosa]HCJ1449551.1 AAA family ATPase [Pseudomonas aeruginosa]HCJ4896402.1 AAA family ATPase [Pseudomonas aeruginosa]